MAISISISSFGFVMILVCSVLFAEANKRGGFTVELIPRGSPKSPFYNPSETTSQRIGSALRRSIKRVARFKPKASKVPSPDITSAQGEYLINITIGTPPVPIVGIADTGSDLIWTQCKPCKQCFDQDAPLFQPNKSSSYEEVSCDSHQCRLYDQTSCSSRRSTCQYEASYGDGSFTSGSIATDIISLDSTSGNPIEFPNTVFGCGNNNDGTFDSRTSGIVGLGGGDASLISQIGRSSGGKFSYCLVPFFSESKHTSKLNFGDNAEVVGKGAVSTPLIQKSQKTFYYLTLEGISVNGEKFEVSGLSQQSSAEGNIIIDSGTTLTLLPPDFYEKIEPAVAAAISLPKADDPSGNLRLCYESSGAFKDGPEITVHFTDADVKLNWYNAFINIAENIACFTFVPSSLDLAIYGNLAHMNFLVGYDIMNQMLSFKPADCTEH